MEERERTVCHKCVLSAAGTVPPLWGADPTQVEVANFRGCEVSGVQLPQSCPVHTSPNLKVLQNFNYFAFIYFWNVIE